MKPPEIDLSAFVGRTRFVEDAQESLLARASLSLHDIEGVEGAGKTTLLVKLYRTLEDTSECRPLWLGMKDFDPRPPRGEASERERLLRNYDKFRSIAAEVAETAGAEERRAFQERADAIADEILTRYLEVERKVDVRGLTVASGSVHGGLWNRLGSQRSGDVSVAIHVPDADLAPLVLEAQRRIADELVATLSAAAGPRLALLVDDWAILLDEPLAGWLFDLVRRLEAPVVLLGRSESQQTLGYEAERTVRRTLENFTPEETEECLVRLLGRERLPERLAARVHELTGGHPQAVALCADIAKNHGLDAPDLIDAFERLPEGRNARLGELVKRMIAEVDDPAVRDALEVGCILRRFDADVLRAVLAAGSEQEDGAADRYDDIVERLEEFTFTEFHAGDGESEAYWKFHDFVRHAEEARLVRRGSRLVERLHARAADYYGRLLTDDEEDRERASATARDRWRRYEDPDWQALEAEWLYHVGALEDRRRAQLAFARVFLDAFWWWGCYAPFPFCERLLRDWRLVARTEDDRAWLAALEQVHDGYPLGYAKAGDAAWPAVETKLLYLLRAGGLDRRGAALDPTERHVRAIVHVFLAHARRFQDAADARATRYYAEAARLLGREDPWALGWIVFEAAELADEQGRPARALARARRALRIAWAERDYELIANVHRLRGDIAARTDAAEAVEEYALATLAAYAFQLDPVPDFYTSAFLGEIGHRLALHLDELAGAGRRDEAAAACARLREFWSPYWSAVGGGAPPDDAALAEEAWYDAVVWRLVPRAPAEDELGKRGTAYFDVAARVLHELEDVLAADEARAGAQRRAAA